MRLRGRLTPTRIALLLVLGSLLVLGVGRLHGFWLAQSWEQRAPGELQERLREVEARTQRLREALQSAADRVASLPQTRDALLGDRLALSRLFRSLESAGGGEWRPALAVHALPFSTIAWAGRNADVRGLEPVAGTRRGVFVIGGTVTTTLVATAPVRGAAGVVKGMATAEVAVKVHRNIRNEYLRDFDLLAGSDPGIEVHYVDARDETPRPFASLPAGVPSQESLLRGSDGSLLAAVRVTLPAREDTLRSLALFYRKLVSALASAALLLWAFAPGPQPDRRLRLALAVTLLRVALLVLGPPLLPASSGLLSPDVYASTLLGPLLKSPLDLLLTALWTAALAGLLLDGALRVAPRAPSWTGTIVSSLLALPLLGLVFGWVADTSANCALDLEAISLFPRHAPHAVLQVALLLILATGLLLLISLLAAAGPFPERRGGRLGRALFWTALGLLAFYFWPREIIGLPLLPAIVLFLLAALLAGTHAWWRSRLASCSAGSRAGLAIASVAVFSLLLYPSLAHYGERNTRLQIERDHAPLILRQPQWREYVLAESQRRIDALNLLEDSPPGPSPPGIEELAFSVWSATDLVAFAFSSAVEIQDASGVVISRFALNLPSLEASGPPRPLPADGTWQVSRERLTLASAERRVLHARRRLYYHGEVHGAVHLYVGDDFWNLPFIPARDPYSALYRTSSRGTVREQPISLLVFDAGRGLVFSSADRPPVVGPELAARLRQSPGGLWATLPIDGRPHHIFFFGDGPTTYGLAYPQVGPSRYGADLVEAMAGLTLLALLVLLLLILVRTALRRPRLSLVSLFTTVRRRFALRLFVAFVSLAFVPVVVLQVVVRRFVADRLHQESEDQALELAAVAKKAVEDFAFFQRGEAPGHEPVTDAALVWVSSLIRNDLDVFGRGQLLASSKRELYASGLLPPRVSGSVYRALVLDQMPSVIRTEAIGGFSTLVVSVPVRLDAPEPGVLSIPLALRQREVQATLDELERATRLASVGFLVFAAALAHSMSRRISGPIRDLTQATRRVAQGDLDARVATTSRDELRGLVESFNQMAGDLDRQRRDLERSNRLAAWAEMARQVAHEVKNPLTPIQLSAEHLRRVFGDPDVDFPRTLAACTDTILKQVRTLRGIVTEFSAFARPPAARLEPEDLTHIVRTAVAPYLAGLPPGVRLAVEAPERLPRVRVDRRLLERAVLNLVENALQAVGDRGSVVVRLRSEDGRAEVEVEDSGPGIEPEVQERMFEPFFSTKTSGSGLGLALVKKIAEGHGGGVALLSAPGAGTRAVLWLPVEAPAAGEAQ